MRVAIAQVKASYFAKEENEEKILSLTEKAIQQKVDLLLFPEAVNLGYFILDPTRNKDEAFSLALELAPDFSSPWVEELKRKARRGIHMACGGLFKIEENKLVNALLLFSPKGEISAYYKTHLYHLKEIREEDFVIKGNELKVVDTDLGKIGLSICYDLNFPEVARTLALNGAQIILLAAAWPKMAGATWDILLPARALENEVYLLASGQTGGEYYGHSKIIDYEGNILAEFEEEEGLKIAEIDLARQEKWRKIVTLFEDRRPKLYRLG
ncbi:Deaminated glutathione amidase [subsurface metagenome]